MNKATTMTNGVQNDTTARGLATRSMTAVTERDREGWLALWAADGCLEDPVGRSPLDPSGEGWHGRDGLSRFWDTTIETLESIRFELHDSFACGDEVANVATLHLVLPGGATARNDGVFVYRANRDGELASLRAFWEMDRMLATIAPPTTG